MARVARENVRVGGRELGLLEMVFFMRIPLTALVRVLRARISSPIHLVHHRALSRLLLIREEAQAAWSPLFFLLLREEVRHRASKHLLEKGGGFVKGLIVCIEGVPSWRCGVIEKVEIWALMASR